MTLTRWEPSAHFGVLRNPMDRMFDEAFGRSARALRNNGASRYVLPIDMYETADELLVKAHLPGIDPAQVQLNVEKGHLTIQAHIPSEAEQGERPQASLALPRGVVRRCGSHHPAAGVGERGECGR